MDVYYWMRGFTMSSFAERLKLLRQARNITQVRLAKLLNVTARHYNRWEKGNTLPHFETMVRIADILQISLDELAGRKEPSSELKIRNHELRQLCQQCDELSDEDQKALIVMIDSLIKKSHMEKVVGKNIQISQNRTGYSS